MTYSDVAFCKSAKSSGQEVLDIFGISLCKYLSNKNVILSQNEEASMNSSRIYLMSSQHSR